MEANNELPPIVTTFKEWEPGTTIPAMEVTVVRQEEVVHGKYGEGVHNIIEDDCGNCLVLSTWRTHKHDLQEGKSYIICNVVVDHFRPPDSWYQRNQEVIEDSFWMSLPYEDGFAILK